MSDRYNPLGVSGLIRPTTYANQYRSQYSNPYTGGWQSQNTLTEYEQRLAPVYQEQEAADLAERRKIQPLQMIFDVLQRPQYASANLVRGILRGDNAKEILSAVWSGLTGKEKTSYEDVINEANEEWGSKKIFKNADEDKWIGQLDRAKVLGFLGDVFLDPTTYVGFGASKGAIAAARKYADDAVRVATQTIGKAAGETGAAKIIGNTVGQQLDQVWRRAYRRALRESPDALKTALRQNIDEAGEVGRRGLADLMEKLNRPSTYEGAGTSAWNLGLLGRSEVGRGTREGYNTLMRRMSKAFKENPGSVTLQNAWFSKMNSGVVGKLREALGFRSPYQAMLRKKELQAGRDFLENREGEIARKVLDVTRDFDDETGNAIVRLNALAEKRRLAKQATEAVPETSKAWGGDIGQTLRQRQLRASGGFDPEVPGLPVRMEEVLDDPEIIAQLGIKDVEKVRKKWREIQGITDEWLRIGHELEAVTGVSVKELPDYLPLATRTGGARRTGTGAGSGFAKHRVMTRAQHDEIDIAKMEWLYGVDRADAIDMLNTNPGLSELNKNIQDGLIARGLAQAKLEKRAHLIEQFKEFGIHVEDLGEAAQRTLVHPSFADPAIGLAKIQGIPGLDNMVFDYDVARVAQHALDMTAPGYQIPFKKAFQGFTSFWKRVVTMTPGFHLRNFYSNQITQFLKHGSSAFKPRTMGDAAAGVAYALSKGNLKKTAEELGYTEQMLKRALNHQYGNFTVQELADEALRRNVISRQLQLQDAETLAEEIGAKMNANPFSKDFAGAKLSRKAGERVENFSRFQSFLMDYGDTATRNMGDIAEVGARKTMDDEALEYAAQEAKKWFMDYGDLSEFEKNTLKNVIPFYSWLRKNLANQISAVTLYPEMFSVVPKLEDFFTYEHPEYDPDMIPPWMKQLGMFPTGKLEDGSFRMFNPNFPYQDLNRIPLVWEEGRLFPRVTLQEAKEDLISAMHPLVATAMSAATEQGYDFFHKTELGEDAAAPYLMRLFASNPAIMGLIDGIQRARGVESPIRIDDEGKLRIDARTAQALENNMPLLRWFEFLFYLPQAVIPGLEDVIESATNAQDEYEGIEETLQLMSYYLGIKFKPLDLEAEKARIATDLYYQARDVLNEESRQQPGSETRRMEYNNRTQESIRRLRGY